MLLLLRLLLHKGLYLRLDIRLRLHLGLRLSLRLQQRRCNHVLQLPMAVQLMQLAAKLVLLLLVDSALQLSRKQSPLQLRSSLVGANSTSSSCCSSKALLVHATLHLSQPATCCHRAKRSNQRVVLSCRVPIHVVCLQHRVRLVPC